MTHKKRDGHQLGPMTHFSDLNIWPTFIYRGEVPSNTFAKLPVHVLINDPKKLDPKSSWQLQTHHLVMWPTSRSRSQNFGTSPKLPVSAPINPSVHLQFIICVISQFSLSRYNFTVWIFQTLQSGRSTSPHITSLQHICGFTHLT